MKKNTFFSILFFLIILLTINDVNAQEKQQKNQAEGRTPNGMIRCSTEEYEALMRAEDPRRLSPTEFQAYMLPLVEKYKLAQQVSSQSGGIIYIPVVVHVIHNGDAYGVDENIRDEQVESQITVMNQDFRRLAGTPGFNSNPVGADTQIQFVLAKVDPNGNPTNGIDRVNLCTATYNVGSFSQIQNAINTNVKPQTTWDSNTYMNMWCVNWDGSGLLGYGQFPSASNSTTVGNTDGVVAGHSYFGSRTIFPAGTYGDTTYDKGRTMTHEVGHFLGLKHIWGDGDCTVDDGIADTPNAGVEHYGCPTGADTCADPGIDMVENYMDYTDDSCMNIFTTGQKDFIATVMNTFPRRTSLKTSVADLAITLFANDAEVKIENSCGFPLATCANPIPSIPAKVISLYNRGTAILTSATISYNINGGTAYTNNWTGSLAPNAFTYITLANTSVNGTLNVSITNTNGGTDQRTTNNTASKTFTTAGSPTPVPYYNSTNYIFRLVGDRYGLETTWNLKDANGTILYSGGPYTNLNSNTTQVLVNNQAWTLPTNGCYTFTINDSYGDGINSGAGVGSYSIKTGLTTVASGGSFASTESKFFTNTVLETPTFNTLSNIYVYPNPSKSTINIALPDGQDLPNQIVIANTLGQTIYSKKVTSINDLTLNTSSYSNGIYFITVERNNEKKTLQFIKE